MTTECYITIHSTDLIRECEARDQFAMFDSHTYLFVGRRPVDDMPDGVKVIVARDYTPNYEHLPMFYDFTGWWVLAHHDLITADHVVFLQYDMHPIDVAIEIKVDRMLDARPGMIAFNSGFGGPTGPNWMLRIPGFEALYREALWEHQRINPDDFPPFDQWPSTQGTAWRRDDIVHFMNWFTPFFEAFQGHTFAGHLAERTVKAWSVVNHPEQYMLGAIAHAAADLHGTGALMAGNQALYEQRDREFRGLP